METWLNWLLSNWSRLLNLKGPGTLLQSSKLFENFQKNIPLAYIYELTMFGWLMSCDSKDIIQKCTVSFITIYHDITDLLNHGIVENTKAWISQEWNITFL